MAAYSERYRRDQDDIDDRLKERYSTTMKEQQAKIPQITQAIRGQDGRLDGTMNNWVWGGKAAALPIGGPTGRGHSARVLVTTPTTPHEESPNENLSSSTSRQDEVQVEDDESQLLSNKERKRRRKERKEQKLRQKEQEAEQRRLETQRQTLVYQSVAAGATIGAVAVAASVFLGNPRK